MTCCAVESGIDLREDVALLHDGVEVDVDLRDAPVDLRADVDLEERLHRARRLHLLGDVTDGDRRGHEARWRRRTMRDAPPEAHRDDRRDASENRQPA